MPNTTTKTIQALKNILKLIKGEIQAGNKNPMLIKDLYKKLIL